MGELIIPQGGRSDHLYDYDFMVLTGTTARCLRRSI